MPLDNPKADDMEPQRSNYYGMDIPHFLRGVRRCEASIDGVAAERRQANSRESICICSSCGKTVPRKSREQLHYVPGCQARMLERYRVRPEDLETLRGAGERATMAEIVHREYFGGRTWREDRGDSGVVVQVSRKRGGRLISRSQRASVPRWYARAVKGK